VSFAGEDQKCGLSGILRGMVVPKNPAAHTLDESCMSPDEQLERSFVPRFGEPIEKIGIGWPCWVIPGGNAQIIADNGVAHVVTCRANGRSIHPKAGRKELHTQFFAHSLYWLQRILEQHHCEPINSLENATGLQFRLQPSGTVI
jgi:hypothetical protein